MSVIDNDYIVLYYYSRRGVYTPERTTEWQRHALSSRRQGLGSADFIFVNFMVACIRSKTKCGCGTLSVRFGRVSVAENWGGRMVVELVRVL